MLHYRNQADVKPVGCENLYTANLRDLFRQLNPTVA